MNVCDQVLEREGVTVCVWMARRKLSVVVLAPVAPVAPLSSAVAMMKSERSKLAPPR